MANRKPRLPHSGQGTKPTNTGNPAQASNPAQPSASAAPEKPAAAPTVTAAATPRTTSNAKSQQTPAERRAARAAQAARPAANSSQSTSTGPRWAENTVNRMSANREELAQLQPARLFSGKLLALIGVVVLVAVIVTPSLNLYLQQRSEIASVKADIQAKKDQQTQLKKDISRWDDPAYVKQQARERVNMVMPGETGFWVYGTEQGPAAPQQDKTSANPQGLPWVDGLWDSIVRSGTQ